MEENMSKINQEDLKKISGGAEGDERKPHNPYNDACPQCGQTDQVNTLSASGSVDPELRFRECECWRCNIQFIAREKHGYWGN